MLTAIGAGGIKPCISAFGGDQFMLPDQQDLLEKFFSIFYFAINAGSLCSVFVTPELRQSVHCFGDSSCFPLAFGMPAVLMLISMGSYAICKPIANIYNINCLKSQCHNNYFFLYTKRSVLFLKKSIVTRFSVK